MLKSNLRSFSIIFILGIFLIGCSEEGKKDVWKTSDTFTKDNIQLYGTKGKFGIIKVNGKADEPEFPVGQGRQYDVYFLDNSNEYNGKKYKMSGTHKDTKETVQLYEWDIENNKSGAKFFLSKQGLWKINVSIDEKPFTSFVVKAEEN
jgi:hypothetical protein